MRGKRLTISLRTLLIFLLVICLVYWIFFYSKRTPRQPKYQPQYQRNQQDVGEPNEECIIFKTIQISHTPISEDEPCEASFCPTLDGNKRKIASYLFTQAEPYMAQLEPSPTLESIYKGPGTSSIEIPVFVGGASSNHMGEALRLIKHLNKDIRPAYPTLKLFFYDLGLTVSQFQEALTPCVCFLLSLWNWETSKEEKDGKLQNICNCTMVKFPFAKFPEHVKQLFGYTWKPLIIKMMLQNYRFVIWLDTSVILETADLDPLFIRAKHQGVMSRCDTHLLAAHTHEDTFQFLQEPPCLYRKYKEFIGRLLIFHSDNKLVNDYVIQPWVKCALSEECMKTKHSTGGELLRCPSHKIYHSCHRYDQAVLSMLIYRLFPESYMDHHIDDTFFIPR